MYRRKGEGTKAEPGVNSVARRSPSEQVAFQLRLARCAHAQDAKAEGRARSHGGADPDAPQGVQEGQRAGASA